MIKTSKKTISILVATMFILTILSGSVLASLSYENARPASYPWIGSNVPYAVMTNSDGTLNVLAKNSDQGYLDVNPTQAPVLESVVGNYGKASGDDVYKTYDTEARTSYYPEQGCFTFTSTKNKDTVIEFSFAYDNSGNNTINNGYAPGLLMRSAPRFYDSQACSNSPYTDIDEMLSVKETGINFTADTTKTGLERGTWDTNAHLYNFEPGKWYTVNLVFDFENRTSADSNNLQTKYTYKAYVNGVLTNTCETTTAHYGFRWFRLFPAPGATMYWDNIICYTINDANTFEPKDISAELVSESDDIVVSDDQIELSGLTTVDDVKQAVSASLKENETVRIYNSDYTQEISDDALTFDTKLVVAGSRALTTNGSNIETIYSYYDIGIEGGYTFDEPTITIDGTKAKGNVKLYNYSGEEKQFKVFLGVYNNDELVELNISDTDLVAEEKSVEEFTTPEADLTGADKIKLFVWNADGITPELECVERSYTLPDEYDPKNADLKSITLPMVQYKETGYKGTGILYPSFNKDVTEYTVFSYMKSYAGEEVNLETVNSDAAVTLTTAPDTSLDNTYAVYTVTSADGTVTKDYKINYIANEGTSLNITGIKNGLSSNTGTRDFYTWMQGTNVWEYANVVIQDGTVGGVAIKATRPIIEIDITNGPAEIKHGILTLSISTEIYGTGTAGKLHLYKIDDSIYNDGGLTAISHTQTENYFDDEICTVNIGRMISDGDMYYINIGADYYNSLKAAGQTKMYIGLAGEAADSSKAMGTVFGQGGAKMYHSRFNYITE